MTRAQSPLWRCPACGHEFVTRNMAHSCVRCSIDSHFESKEPAVREAFDQLRAFVESIGPVTVYAQKTRIVFQTRARFIGVSPRKRWLDGTIWLKRPAAHPVIRRVEPLLDRDFVHHFRLTRWPQGDEALKSLIRESYRVGSQESGA